MCNGAHLTSGGHGHVLCREEREGWTEGGSKGVMTSMATVRLVVCVPACV